MIPFHHIACAFGLVGILCSSAASAQSDDARFGIYDCRFPALPFGTLTLSANRYVFKPTEGQSSGGDMVWSDEAFGLSGGRLPGFGIESGLVYAVQDASAPGLLADLYSHAGVAVTCRKIKP